MKRLSPLWLAGMITMSLLSARPARADVVGEPPVDCVDGSIGQACHGGPYCAPDLCTTSADCDGGKVCQDHNLCTGQIDCGGLGGPDSTTQVTGACGESCPAGSACTVQKVCVTPSGGTGGAGGTPSAGGAGAGDGGGGGGGGTDYVATGCACDLGSGSRAIGAAGALLLAAGLAGLGGRRRRRRR